MNEESSEAKKATEAPTHPARRSDPVVHESSDVLHLLDPWQRVLLAMECPLDLKLLDHHRQHCVTYWLNYKAAVYLQVRRGRYGGTVVAALPQTNENPLDEADRRRIKDVLAFRSVVEPAVAELAAGASLTASQRNNQMVAHEAVNSADPMNYWPLDAGLHVMIADLSGSTMLAKADAEARDSTSELLDRIPFLKPNTAHSRQQHEEILNAILRSDGASLKELVEEHLEDTASLLRGFLD